MDTSNLVTIAQYATLIGKSPVTIRQKCLRGNLLGAIKIGRDWLIPADAPYTDNRVTSGNYKNWRKKSSE